MVKGFKDFILRGNVVDLAVAFVMGVAFAAVITAFTGEVIQPIINAFGGGDDPGLGFQITDNPATFVDIGAVITAIINFLIVGAAVYFFVVVPVNALLALREGGYASWMDIAIPSWSSLDRTDSHSDRLE